MEMMAAERTLGWANVFTSELTNMLQSGCSLVVGTASSTGEPRASRGWGLDVIDAASGRIRLLVADDPIVIEHLAPGGRLAVTGADVRTLGAAQLKGTVKAIEPASAADYERSARYCDDFFGDVIEMDGIARELLDRLVPAGLMACEIIVDEMFDQTPGPSAGAVLANGPT